VIFLVMAGLVALGVHAATVLASAAHAERALERLTADFRALRAADTFAGALARIEGHAARYASTRDPAWREAFEADGRRVDSALVALRAASLSGRDREIVDEIAAIEPRYLESAREVVGGAAPVAESAQSLLPRLQRLADEFVDIRAADLSKSADALDAQLERDRRSTYFTLAAVGVTSGLLALLLIGRVVAPLAQFRRALDALGRGRLGERVRVGGVDEVGALAAAFNHMAAQLEEERERLIVMSLTDALTGLANRRYFDRQLEREVARARRYRRALALIMVDLDHFKRLNDTHGHQAGDRVLADVARVIEREVRPSDAVARVGGEEFAVILSEASFATAVQVAERLRRAVAGRAPRPGGDGAADFVPITASFGVAVWAPGMEGKALFAAADEALYRAKQRGRNRVEAAGVLEPEQEHDVNDPRR
jgi:diguanylate cyclase (GGDEF)-like protein